MLAKLSSIIFLAISVAAIAEVSAPEEAVWVTRIGESRHNGARFERRSRKDPGTTLVERADPPTTSPADVKAKALQEHNAYRSSHGAGPLAWDDQLAAYAQKVANTCVFRHSGGPNGENIGASAGIASKTIVDGIKMWETEAPHFNCENPSYSHFTQMVWRSTGKLGCAEANCPTGSVIGAPIPFQKFWVCEYSDTVGNSGNKANYCLQVTGK